MAIGDVIQGGAAYYSSATKVIQPASGVEWRINNISCNYMSSSNYWVLTSINTSLSYPPQGNSTSNNRAWHNSYDGNPESRALRTMSTNIYVNNSYYWSFNWQGSNYGGMHFTGFVSKE